MPDRVVVTAEHRCKHTEKTLDRAGATLGEVARDLVRRRREQVVEDRRTNRVTNSAGYGLLALGGLAMVTLRNRRMILR